VSRELNPAETQVLNGLVDKIQEIANLADEQHLRATGVLDDGLGAQDYADLHQHFQRLPARLRELIALGKVVVNESLDPSMGANTLAEVKNGVPEATIELVPPLVAADSSTPLTDRAITLIHELSHAIYEAPDFPIKDYTYRKSWAQGYLAGQIGWRNADTYAEAAARLAEEVETKPGTTGRPARPPPNGGRYAGCR
jgi:hypothetical protein